MPGRYKGNLLQQTHCGGKKRQASPPGHPSLFGENAPKANPWQSESVFIPNAAQAPLHCCALACSKVWTSASILVLLVLASLRHRALLCTAEHLSTNTSGNTARGTCQSVPAWRAGVAAWERAECYPLPIDDPGASWRAGHSAVQCCKRCGRKRAFYACLRSLSAKVLTFS